MIRRKSVTEARKDFTRISKSLPVDDVIAVTSHGRDEVAIMRWEFYESIEATLEIISDPNLLVQIKNSMEDIKAGRLVSLEELEKEVF
ncbi:MAG: type II toxin-antitoxin system Phd/YefM family antitoxin [Spirochaetota bacterium]|nr:type II toxin-antitoxin system Phd/YefM family antitoxin [Spirochaetota bacterium]